MDGTWLQLADKSAYELLNPHGAPSPEVIAHSLAQINRFTGHTKFPYSVAQHSFYVASKVPKEDRLWALLHDAHECVTGDIATPIQWALGQQEACNIRERLHSYRDLFVEHFGLDSSEPYSVRVADARMLITERDQLIGVPPKPWRNEVEPYDFAIECWDWRRARDIYLAELMAELGR